MTKSKLLLFFFIVWLITGCTNTDPVPINIVPLPEQQVAGNSHFTFSKNTVIQVETRRFRLRHFFYRHNTRKRKL